MADGITLLAAECVAPPLLRVGLWPVHLFAEAPLVRLGDQLPFHQPRQRADHGPVNGRPRRARPRHLHPQASDEVRPGSPRGAAGQVARLFFLAWSSTVGSRDRNATAARRPARPGGAAGGRSPTPWPAGRDGAGTGTKVHSATGRRSARCS
jgi:hypothetical protein